MKTYCDIFISYRRDGGDVMAKYLYNLLKGEGYNVFYDFETLSSGRFGDVLTKHIEECNDFVLILSKNIFKDKNPETDWVQKEIHKALAHNKNIIPVQLNGFDFPKTEELGDYSEDLRAIFELNSVVATNIGKFSFNDLKKFLKSKPVELPKVMEHSLELLNQIPEVLEEINDDTKKGVLKTLVYSLVKEKNADMVYGMLKPYVNSNYNLRLDFDYRINLEVGFDFLGYADISSNKYYKLKERFTYTKRFIRDKMPKVFYIKFDTGLADLDGSLHAENVLFSEDFNIEKEDVEKLINMNDEQKRDFVNNVLRLQLVINRVKMEPKDILYSNSGIHIKYEIEEDFDILYFKTSFAIPFNKNTKFFFASISEPTYSPSVIFSFDPDYFDVKMIPFLSQNVISKDAMAIEGEIEFNVTDEWVLPMSGAVFIITEDNFKL